MQEALTNVRKHSHASRLRIRVKRTTREITVLVSDNGRGFNGREKHAVDNAARRGLGLAAMQERAVMLGGRLKIRSEVGQGTEIGLTFPTGYRINNGKTFRIILVDDHTLFRQAIRAIIEEIEDLEIIGEAGDGLELLELLRKMTPDLLILDIAMPRMRGSEAVYEVKASYPKSRSWY